MSSVELNEEIQLAHETNPLLELVDEADNPVETDSQSTEESPPVDASETGPDILPQLEFDNVGNLEDNDSIWDAAWDDRVQSDTPPEQRRTRSQDQGAENSDYLLQIPEAQQTLREVLGNQVIFLLDTEDQRVIAHHIIQNVNEAGYLDISLEEIHQQIAEQESTSPATGSEIKITDMEQVLSLIQGLEPAGVAARSPQECLRVQLDTLNTEATGQVGHVALPGYDVALNIINHHLQLLGARDYTKLRRILGVSESNLAEAIELITHLNPHPGHAFNNTRVDYIVPDILVEKKGEFWLARHNPDSLPKLGINRNYQSLINQAQGRGQNQAQEYSGLKEQLQNAKWLLSNIEKRHQTILSVAREIVEKQQGFFQSGLKAMKPMILSDIATPLGIHESTVSRATTGKYLLAPQGIFELKYFFSSQLIGDDGQAVSSRSIQTVIRSIIDTEDSRKPVSDEKICALLSEKGLKVARRTVAKYREQLNIPSSSKRKTM